MNWLETSAERVREVKRTELINDFDMYDEGRRRWSAYLWLRNKEGKKSNFAQVGDLEGALKYNRSYSQEV